MTQEQFDHIAGMHARREAYRRLSKTLSDQVDWSYKATISPEDLALIGDSLLEFAERNIREIDNEVEKL